MSALVRQYHSLLSEVPAQKPNILDQGRQPSAVKVLGAARIGGLAIFVPSGGGKSILMGKNIALSDARNRIPQCIIDVQGSCIANYLHALLFLSRSEQQELISRTVYCDLSGSDGFVTSWPILYPRTPNERLYTTASRLPELLGFLDENFANATIQGLTRTIPIGVATGKLLTALELPITEIFSLLRYPELYVDRIKESVRRNPEAASGAQDLFDYMEIPKRQRNERIEPFLNRLQHLRHDEVSRALFGSPYRPTIDFAEVCQKQQTCLIDLSGDRSKLSRQFKLQFVFNLLLEYIEHRGRGAGPLSVLVDELSFFVKGAAFLNTHAIAEQFRQLIEQNMRNNEVLLSLATQDIRQIPPEMLTAVLNMKNMLFGAVSDPETAEYLANRFMRRNPWDVKYWERVWATENYGHGYIEHKVIDHRPQFLPLADASYLNARRFMELPKGTFLFAESAGEGEVATSVRRVTARHLFHPPFPPDNAALLQTLKSYLVQRDGIPLTTVLREIDTISQRPLPLPETADSKPAGVSENGQGESPVTANGQGQQAPNPAALPQGNRQQPPPFEDGMGRHRRESDL